MRVRAPSPQAALTVAGALFALAWGGLLAAWHLDGNASVVDRLEAPLVDLRFQISGPRPAPREVVIVAIDDETTAFAGRYPLPRATVARLVDEIARRGARAIGIDVLFVDAGGDGDVALAAALSGSRAVLAAAALFDRGAAARAGSDVPQARGAIWPLEALRQVTSTGFVNVATDHAGTPHHIPLLIGLGDGTVGASFALRVASLAAGQAASFERETVRLGGRTTPLDLGRHMALRFYGPRGSIRTLSAREVLEGSPAAETLRGKVVVVGATAFGSGDTFATPFDPVLPGVEVLATGAAHLLSGDALRRTGAERRVDAAATVALPLAAVGLMALRRSALGLALIPALALAWLAVTALAFDRNLWLSAAVPLAALLPPALFTVGGRLWLDRLVERRLERSEATFRRFHPQALADRLAAAPDFLSEPVQQQAAALFIDLSGFTGLAERLGPERTRELLKAFHSIIEAEVTRLEGYVVSFMGDGAMVVFGIPEARADDARRAVEAALGLSTKVSAWLTEVPEAAGIGVRVGGHVGPVVVSRLGAETHEHITATGDCVNVASRLLEVAAGAGASAALSADLVAAARASPPGLGAPQTIPIRGRAQPLAVRLWRGG